MTRRRSTLSIPNFARVICRVFCVLLLLTAASLAADDTTSDGFISIFNGKDLTDWVGEGATTYQDGDATKPVWTVEDGMLTCAGKGYGFLRYDKQTFGDFVWKLEYRQAPKCNSGVGIRHAKFTPGKIETRASQSGYEIQILDDGGKTPSKGCTGSLYRYVAPKSIPAKPAGQWNQMIIECRGSKIKITLNGEVIQDVDQSSMPEIKDKPLSGYISVQNHGGKINFRNLQVKELK